MSSMLLKASRTSTYIGGRVLIFYVKLITLCVCQSTSALVQGWDEAEGAEGRRKNLQMSLLKATQGTLWSGDLYCAVTILIICVVTTFDLKQRETSIISISTSKGKDGNRVNKSGHLGESSDWEESICSTPHFAPNDVKEKEDSFGQSIRTRLKRQERTHQRNHRRCFTHQL